MRIFLRPALAVNRVKRGVYPPDQIGGFVVWLLLCFVCHKFTSAGHTQPLFNYLHEAHILKNQILHTTSVESRKFVYKPGNSLALIWT